MQKMIVIELEVEVEEVTDQFGLRIGRVECHTIAPYQVQKWAESEARRKAILSWPSQPR